MAISASALRTVRLLHLNVGVFIAPALLFFALSGALQTVGLHESARGSSYQPPRWIVVLAQIHKKQTPVVPTRRPGPARPEAHEDHGPTPALPSAAGTAPPPEATAGRVHHTVPMKVFFLIVSLGLFASTLSGIAMSYAYARNKRWITALLLLGTVLPLLFVWI